MADRPVALIPQPKELTHGDGAFRLDSDTWIVLAADAGAPDHFAAQSLQAEIESATGLHLAIVKTRAPARKDNLILLTSSGGAAAALIGESLPWDSALATHGDQSYCISVAPKRVIAGGLGYQALHHAVQSLRQLARVEHSRWPALEILDWPSLAYRGLMLDVSRGKVPTLDTLKLIVDELSLFKLNVLQLYTEHTFLFPHHPLISEGCGPLTGEEMLELDRYARARHVELVPNLNCFGHCAHLLSLPEYEHLAESLIGRWSLCPTDEATYAFLSEQFGDLLPNFQSTMFNVGCDETYDLGKGRSADEAAKSGTGRLYLAHLLRLHELAAQHGRRIQIWGDILLHYPDLVSELPDDVVLLDWHYGAADDYPSVRTFADSGRTFWVCPGTSSWNALFPRIDNANDNIRTLARLGAEQGAEGMLNTDWGDYGHYQPLGQCWYGYVCGGAQAWTGGASEDEDFDASFGPLHFGSSGERIVSAMRELARLNTLPGMVRRNGSNSIYSLLDEPLVGDVSASIPVETLDEIDRVCTVAEAALRGALAACRDRLSVQEMIYSARMMSYAAHKARTTQRVRARIAALGRGEGEAAAVLHESIDALRQLNTELQELTEVFEDLWMRRAKRSEIDITLAHFSRLGERYVLAQEWLRGRLAALEAGQTVDNDLTDYAERARSYEILGQGVHRRLKEAGVTFG